MTPHQISAFLGVCVGDAVGAVLEFFYKQIEKEDVELAMTMPGGGVFRVGRGQPTDDTELTISLFRALIENNSTASFPLKLVARNYIRWMNRSRPFDVGRTTQLAFHDVSEDQDIVACVRHNALSSSLQSESNGALMRIIPIPIFYHLLQPSVIAKYAREDASLSHPNKVCQDCNATYSIAVSHLINYPKDSQGAISMSQRYLREQKNDKVYQWFMDALEPNFLSLSNCTKQIGHVKHAFQLAFHCLCYELSFEESIFQTLLKGGDTDTNAAIVGGLMGAFHGRIPDELSKPVLDFDCTKDGRIRPVTYSVRRMLSEIQNNI